MGDPDPSSLASLKLDRRPSDPAPLGDFGKRTLRLDLVPAMTDDGMRVNSAQERRTWLWEYYVRVATERSGVEQIEVGRDRGVKWEEISHETWGSWSEQVCKSRSVEGNDGLALVDEARPCWN